MTDRDTRGEQVSQVPRWRARLILVFFSICCAGSSAVATGTFCAVVERTADGYVNLRDGPSPQHHVVGRVLPSDFLWVATEQCRLDFGKMQCDDTQSWVFVEKVHALRDRDRDHIKGWAKAQFVRPIACRDE